jgi:flavin reductase (DIM6/NTAB) family NADH-FMN oxidoreductase RutF
LAEDHGAACWQLASRSGDRFAGLDFDVTQGGAILVRGASAWFECFLNREIRAGDHRIVLLEVIAVGGGPSVRPLVFHGSQIQQLGPSCA